MKYTPNNKIYQVNVPSDYILPYLYKDKYGVLRYPYDAQMMEYVYRGKTIGEGIVLVSKNSLFPLFNEKELCKKYFKIIKSYMHEYNYAKKTNKQI